MSDDSRGAGVVAALDSVTVDYKLGSQRTRALDRVALAFERGVSTAVIGRSGSGKSTLLSVLSLMRQPTDGRVILAGVDTRDLSERGRARLRGNRIGVVFQAFHLNYGLSARDNVLFPWTFGESSLSRRMARARADSLLHQMGIGELSDRSPSLMSGGQRQRVAIARALFNEPAMLIADEPTGSLDEETAGHVARDLMGLTDSMGTSVVVVTHDAAIAQMADRQVTLVRGRVVHDSGATG